MDDVATELGISKKTLYQHFADKADLVKEVVLHSISSQNQFIENISCKKLNSIELIFEISKYVSLLLKEMNPSITFDVKKYYPEAWKILIEHKTNHIYNNIILNINKGISEGLYRNDLRVELVAMLYVFMINDTCNKEDFEGTSKYSSSEMFEEIVKYHIRGIATPEGLKCFDEILKKEKK